MEGCDICMTAKEMARLSDWLKSKGMTAEETIECLHYIAGSEYEPDEKENRLTSTTNDE